VANPSFSYLVFWAASIATGQGTSGDVRKGLALVERLCGTCHFVRRDAPDQQMIAGVPSFPTIANRPDQTADRVSGRLLAPHPPMPTIALTAAERTFPEVFTLATFAIGNHIRGWGCGR
jgi:hypothetical protein